MPAVIAISGPNEGNWYRLSKRILTCGRDPANAIQIASPRVSRKHFQIRHQDGLYLITDLNSHNGLYVSGNRVEEALLEEGDEIEVGDAVLVFTMRDIVDQADALEQYKALSRRLREDPTITNANED